jgi:hypothetical protein
LQISAVFHATLLDKSLPLVTVKSRRFQKPLKQPYHASLVHTGELTAVPSRGQVPWPAA